MVPPGYRDLSKHKGNYQSNATPNQTIKKTHRLENIILVLGINKFHNTLLQILQIQRVLRRRPRQDIILIINQRRRQLFTRVELDIHPILLHNPLNTPPSNADNAFMIRFRDMEANLRRQLFLQKRKTVDRAAVIPCHVDQEIMVVERLEFNLDVGGGHDFIDLAVFLAADEFTVFVGEFELEPDLVLETLITDDKK